MSSEVGAPDLALGRAIAGQGSMVAATQVENRAGLGQARFDRVIEGLGGVAIVREIAVVERVHALASTGSRCSGKELFESGWHALSRTRRAWVQSKTLPTPFASMLRACHPCCSRSPTLCLP